MKKIAILIALLGILSGCSSENAAPAPTVKVISQTQTPTTQPAATKPTLDLPNFTVMDDAGKGTELYNFAGEPIVLHFWATEGDASAQELPIFERACNVRFLLIHVTDGVKETAEKAQEVIYYNGYTAPAFYDIEGEAVFACNIESAPTTIFIDMFGHVVETVTGSMTAEELDHALELIR